MGSSFEWDKHWLTLLRSLLRRLKVWGQLCYDWRLKLIFVSMIISLKIACGLYSVTAYIRKNTVLYNHYFNMRKGTLLFNEVLGSSWGMAMTSLTVQPFPDLCQRMMIFFKIYSYVVVPVKIWLFTAKIGPVAMSWPGDTPMPQLKAGWLFDEHSTSN